MSTSNVNVVAHPLVQHKLSLMRDKDLSTKGFRELLNEIGMLLCYEVTRDLPLEMVDIETPLAAMKAPKIAGKKLTLAPILRAGVGFLDGMLALVPSARVAHIGLYRDPETLQAVEYFFKAPQDLSDRIVILLDPMLATGNSACAAVRLLKSRGARDIRFVCLLAAPENRELIASALRANLPRAEHALKPLVEAVGGEAEFERARSARRSRLQRLGLEGLP